MNDYVTSEERIRPHNPVRLEVDGPYPASDPKADSITRYVYIVIAVIAVVAYWRMRG